MNSDLAYYNYFFYTLNNSYIKIIYDELNQLSTNYIDYTNNLETINQANFQAKWVNTVFGTTTNVKVTDLDRNLLPNKIIPMYSKSFTNLKLIMTPTYRFLWQNTEKTKNYSPFITLDEIYIRTGKTPLKGTLKLSDWVKLNPSVLIDICSKNMNEPFYYNLLGYNQLSDKIKNFIAPPLSIDVNTVIKSTAYLCSLRLLRRDYKGPCIQIQKSAGQTKDLSFNKKTNMIDISDNEFNDVTAEYLITRFYNQFDDKWTSYLVGDGPIFCITIDGSGQIYLPNIKFNKSSVFKPISKVKVLKYSTTTISCSIQLTGVNSLSSSCFNILAYNRKSIPDDITFIINNGLIGTKTQRITPSPSAPLKTPIKNDIHTISTSCDDSSDTSTNVYRQDKSILENNKNTFSCFPDNTVHDEYELKVFNNSKSTIDINFYCPQIIIFSSDTNIPNDILDTIDDDLLSVWKYPYLYSNNTDLKCIDIVPDACNIDRYNIGCACYPSYVNTDNVGNYVNSLKKNKLINSDPWCIIPECAAITAYKNPIQKNLSTCSSNCISSISAKTQKYGNLNIDNAQVITSCYNQTSSNLSSLNICDPACNPGYICTTDPNNPSSNKCIKNATCNTQCDQGYTCSLTKKGDQKCISSNYTNKCINDSNCDINQYCNDDFKICFPKTYKRNIIIPIIVCFSLVIVGFLCFILYTKHKNKSADLFSKINIIWFLSIFAISIVISFIIYFSIKPILNTSEEYDENNKDNTCSTDNDCDINKNNSCNKNICSCIIGYNSNNNLCDINNNQVCSTLPYLPFSVMTGDYYYSTVINNVIYVFATNCSFKFDGEKWVELAKVDILNQPGFCPYEPSIGSGNSLNTSMCVTYKEKVFVLVPVLSSMNTNSPDKTCIFIFFNTQTNIWTEIPISEDSSLKKLTMNVEKFINNVIVAIVDDDIYIFGGIINTDINDKIFIYNITKTKWKDTITLPNKIVFSSYAAAHTSTDKMIYIIGTGLQSEQTISYYIYAYNPITFTIDKKCEDNLNFVTNKQGNRGGAISYYSNEYITIIGDDSKTHIIIYDIKYSKVFTSSLNIADKNLANILFNSGKQFFINYFIIDSAVCKFELNGFLFIITGSGDIFRCNNYERICSQEQIVNGICNNIFPPINLVPCYGITSFAKPLFYKPSEFVWDCQQDSCNINYNSPIWNCPTPCSVKTYNPSGEQAKTYCANPIYNDIFTANYEVDPLCSGKSQ